MDRYYVQRQSKEFELCKINIQNSDLLGCFLHYRRGSPHFLENNKEIMESVWPKQAEEESSG